MTLDEFRASGVDVEDISKFDQDEGSVGKRGRVYCGWLTVEDTGDDQQGRWSLILENRGFRSNNLPDLEATLYQWAIDSGVIPA